MSDKRAGRAPALFDAATFAEDLNRASDAGRKVALAARSDFEQNGVPSPIFSPAKARVRKEPASHSNAPTVYEISHRRLHD